MKPSIKLKRPLDQMNIEHPVEQVAVIRYALRNSPAGRGLGALGIRDNSVIETYERAANWVSGQLSAIGLAPPTAAVPVYVFELGEYAEPSPHTFKEDDHWACALPSRSFYPDRESELAFMRSSLAHEFAHAWSLSQPATREHSTEPEWRMVAEATAVWVEMQLLSAPEPLRSLDTLTFWRDWCDYPEFPLNESEYAAGILFHYLARRLGPKFIGGIWTGGVSGSDPWLYIVEAAGPQHPLPEFEEAAYFFPDTQSLCYCREAAELLLSRAVTESFYLARGSKVLRDGEVRDFGVRYYAFRLDDADSLDIRFDGDPVCSARVAGAASGYVKTGTSAVLPTGKTVTVTRADYPGLDHFVIVAATEPASGTGKTLRRFSFTATAR